MNLPQICKMKILMKSCLCTLFGLRLSRIFSMSSSVNLIFDKYLLALSKTEGGISPLLLINSFHATGLSLPL